MFAGPHARLLWPMALESNKVLYDRLCYGSSRQTPWVLPCRLCHRTMTCASIWVLLAESPYDMCLPLFEPRREREPRPEQTSLAPSAMLPEDEAPLPWHERLRPRRSRSPLTLADSRRAFKSARAPPHSLPLPPWPPQAATAPMAVEPEPFATAASSMQRRGVQTLPWLDFR